MKLDSSTFFRLTTLASTVLITNLLAFDTHARLERNSQPLPKGLYHETHLKPFHKLLHRRKAKIVALGESHHYSAGLFENKARILQYLVEHEHFRLILWESPFLWAQKANDYISSQGGSVKESTSAKDSMYAFFPYVWWDSSIVKLLDWLKDFNSKHPHDSVVISGFDSQLSPHTAPEYESLSDAIAFLKPKLGSSLAPVETYCLGRIGKTPSTFSLETLNSCLDAIQTLQAKKIHTSKNDQRWTHAALTGLAAHQKMIFYFKEMGEDPHHPSFKIAMESRDHGNAQLVTEIRKFFGNPKTILWAHDFHIARATERWENVDFFQGLKSMGGWLTKHYGKHYLPISFLAYDMRVRKEWAEWEPTPPQTDREDSLEYRFKSLHQGGLWLNTQDTTWIDPETSYESLTTGFRGRIQPAQQYDVIFYQDSSREGDLEMK